MRKEILNLFCLLFLGTGLVLNYSLAQEGEKTGTTAQKVREVEVERALKGIEVLTGFGWNKLKAKSVFDKKPNYNIYPLIVDFDFNLKNLTKRIGFNPPSLVEFQIEPYIAGIAQPNTNVEIGNSFMFKFGLVPETWKFQPFVKAGVGMVYMSLHTEEQSTQFNFISSGGIGAHYFFNKNVSLVVEGRYRHLSNAGIDQPNSGINTYQALAGISYKY